MPVTFPEGARAVCVILALRALPFTAHALLSRRVALYRKAIAASLYALLIVALARFSALSTVGWIACGMAYYLALGCGLNRLSRLVADRTVTRGAAFVLLAVLCLLLPGIALPSVAAPTFLVVGWELLLSGYSYCVDTAREAKRPSTADRLFFLFVDPTLVWARRGSPLPEGERAPSGAARAALGVLVLLLNTSLLRPLHRAVSGGEIAWLAGQPALVGVALYGVLRFLSEYAAHSGLASLQIGWMRQIGWRVPERYELPLFAKSPMDFWRRWNTYVRVWLERYVFLPVSVRAARTSKSRAAQAVAALTVMIASGLLHDGYLLAARQAASTRLTQLFFAVGLVAILWRVAGAAASALRARLTGAPVRWFDASAAVTARVCMALGLTTAGVLWW